ncbi:hypothetical protein B0H13DRAFT_1898518 [Mycena leptocephala]|nr:hypothetical protein B0H13DRAFT_1898518 [Mycena leptocephala]
MEGRGEDGKCWCRRHTRRVRIQSRNGGRNAAWCFPDLVPRAQSWDCGRECMSTENVKEKELGREREEKWKMMRSKGGGARITVNGRNEGVDSTRRHMAAPLAMQWGTTYRDGDGDASNTGARTHTSAPVPSRLFAAAGQCTGTYTMSAAATPRGRGSRQMCCILPPPSPSASRACVSGERVWRSVRRWRGGSAGTRRADGAARGIGEEDGEKGPKLGLLARDVGGGARGEASKDGEEGNKCEVSGQAVVVEADVREFVHLCFGDNMPTTGEWKWNLDQLFLVLLFLGLVLISALWLRLFLGL